MNQEKNISYSPDSGLNSDLHPVRPGAKDTYGDDSNDEEKSVEESEIIKEADTNKGKTTVSETKSNVEEKTTKKSEDEK